MPSSTHTFAGVPAVAAPEAAGLVLGRARVRAQDRVVGVRLDVLLQVLGTLERLAAEVALVGLQGHVDANVRRDVVALDRRRAARIPLARQIQVVGALPAHVTLADVVLERLVSAGAPGR